MNIQNSLVSFFVATFILIGCSQSSDNKPQPQADKTVANQTEEKPAIVIEKTCVLVMGWEPWEPYHYQDPDKKGRTNMVKGLDIELMDMIKVETGCDISYQKGNWKDLLAQLKNGDIDFLTSASINDNRKEYARFSDGYRTESFRLFVRAGETPKFTGYNMKSLIDTGFRLGITMDYIYNDEVDSLQDDPANDDKIISVSTGLINFSKLLEGDIDGFLEDPVVGRSTIRRQGLENEIELHTYEINSGDVHLMFSKVAVDEKVIQQFNQALAKIRSDGRHQRLMDKYTN